MDLLERKSYIFGGIFALANRLQVIGDAYDKNITIKQWLLLAAISNFDKSPTISEIANYIGYSRQNAKRIASILEKEDLITITEDKKDSRALRLSLTEKCITYFDKRGKRDLEFLNLLFDSFDEESIDGLYRGMKLLEKNIKKMETINRGE